MKSQPAYQKYSETSIEVVSFASTFSVIGSSTSRWNFSFANIFIDGDVSELAVTVNLVSLDRILKRFWHTG